MADTVSVDQGVESRTPEPTISDLAGLRRQVLEEFPVLPGLRALRARLIEESPADPHPDPSDCRWSWLEEEAAARGTYTGSLLSWIGIRKDHQCLNRPCFAGWIFFEDSDEAIECPVCLGTGCQLSPEEFAELEAVRAAELREDVTLG